jgi:HK97 family phage major capsid protein/HK97 family phage prohead protease
MPQLRPSARSAAPARAEPGAVVHGAEIRRDLVRRELAQSDADPYEFIMSTDQIDRMGDVVNVAGMDLAAFTDNPIALWNHDANEPIGTWANVRREAGQLIGQLKLAAEGTSQKVDDLRRFLEQRILKSVSVGFRVIEAEPIKGTWGIHFLRSELLECSLVPIGANAEAMRVRSLIPAAPAFLFSGVHAPPGSIQRTGAKAPPPRSVLALPRGSPTMSRTVAERITAHLTRSASIDDELATINETATAENNRDFTDDENIRIAALSSEKTALVENVTTLQAMERAMAARAQNAAPAGRPTIEARAARQEPAGFMIGKLAAVAVLSHLTRRAPEAIIAQRYANDDRVPACFEFVQRAATAIADTTTPGWAAELVRQDVAGFLDDPALVSVLQALRARPSTMSMSFAGAGKITVPSRTNPGNMGGAWVGEAGVIPVVQGTIGSAFLEPTKHAAITTFSRELMNATNDQIETILRNALRRDGSSAIDKALLDNVARVVGVRPKGLANGAHTAASGGADAAAADIQAAIAPILAAGGGEDIVLIMNPLQFTGLAFSETALGTPRYPEVQNGNFKGTPIITSLNVPAGTVYVMDAGVFASAGGDPEFLVSEEAVLTMASADATPPTQAVDGAGVVATAGQVGPDLGIHVTGGAAGAGTAGAVAMSMIQQYAVALRLVLPINWVMARDNMVSTITGVAWGA